MIMLLQAPRSLTHMWLRCKLLKFSATSKVEAPVFALRLLITSRLPDRLPAWKPMTLLVLFGGAEQPRQRKLSARVMEEEGVWMQALAEADDDGAIKIAVRTKMWGSVSAVLRVVGNLSKPLETPLDLSPYP
ncbi:hypothetical protein GGX14DRAFT_391882 [Mycena pura]|uniref:Uncharacterized protein n=1 Tax=Mycena pura TaxID=153505 RepID=A0AAD6YI67_9AGAR|nr:hypothetical protein GGX14DRAFT_391882 [Mycena pura]